MNSPKGVKKGDSPAAPMSSRSSPTPTLALEQSSSGNHTRPSVPSSMVQSSSVSTRQAIATVSRGLLTVIDRETDYACDDDNNNNLMDLSDDSIESDSESDSESDNDDLDNSEETEIDEIQDGDLPLEEEGHSCHKITAPNQIEQQLASHDRGQTNDTQSLTPVPTQGFMGLDRGQARNRFVPEKPTFSDAPGSPRAAGARPGGSSAAKPAVSSSKSASNAVPSSMMQQPTAQSRTTKPYTQQAVTSSDNSKDLRKTQPAKPDPLAPTPAAPYGYRIVKVKKPDGAIVKVKRPIKTEEASMNASSVSVAVTSHATPTNNSAWQKSATGTALVANCQTPSPTDQTISSQTIGSSRAKDTISSPIEASEKRGDVKFEIRVTEKELQPDETGEPRSPAMVQPKSITRQISRIIQILSWFVMIVLPLLFIALGTWAAIVNNKRVPEKYSMISDVDPLTQSIKVAASLWPIVFAAIVAQTLKSYAAWKVERGIPLITLEQLISSHSVGGAVKQPFMLRTLNWTSIVLVLLWALSPLAGQAILRMSYTRYTSPQTGLDLLWIDPYAQIYDDWELSASDGSIARLERVNVMYSDLLLGTFAGQMGPQDQWGNVKIPVYNSTISAVNASGWSTVDWSNGWTSESSLVGYPTFNQDTTSKLVSYNFTLNTTYFDLTCDDLKLYAVNDSKIQALGFEVSPSKTFYVAAERSTNMKTNPSSPDTDLESVPGPSGVLHFGSKASLSSSSNNPDDNITKVWYTTCSYETVLLENLIGCTREDLEDKCRVLFQKLDKSSKAKTPLGLNIAKALANMGTTTENQTTDSEFYAWNPEFAAATLSTSPPWSNKTDTLVDGNGGFTNITLNGERLSKNLGVLINTLNMLGTTHLSFLASNLTMVSRATQVTTKTAPGWTVGQSYVEWQLSVPWLVTLMVCSVILLVAGIASAVLENRTIGPDFLGFANTAIKRSVKLPKEMNHLSARDRLDALTECQVLLQDVKPKAGMGKIALGVKEETSTYLVKGRDYR